MFAHLFRYPRRARDESLPFLRDSDDYESDSEQSDAESYYSDDLLPTSAYPPSVSDHGHAGLDERRDGESLQGQAAEGNQQLHAEVEIQGESVVPRQKYAYVMPLASILTSSCVGLFTFLSYKKGSSAEMVFSWLVSVASVASLQSWAGMLFIYIRCVPCKF